MNRSFDESARLLQRALKSIPLGAQTFSKSPTQFPRAVSPHFAGKAKQVIWLNPESRLTWGYGDSEMPRYVPYCDVVEECRNIQQLYKVIDRIVP